MAGAVMTRRHFALIADTMSAMRHETPEDLFISLCEEFAENLAATNDRFDYHRFMKACGLTQAVGSYHWTLED